MTSRIKTNWEFSGAVNAEHGLGKYKLTLNDQWFTANVWGNGQELSDKATYFGMIKGGKAADEMPLVWKCLWLIWP